MKLNVDFDDEVIKECVKWGRNPVFTIYWAQDQDAYPEIQWQGVGLVILSWWYIAAKSLLAGVAEVELPFKEGPFRLNVRRDGILLYVSPGDIDWEWRITIEDFISELVAAVSLVLQKFAQLNVPDTEGLQEGLCEGMKELRVVKGRDGAMTSTKWRR